MKRFLGILFALVLLVGLFPVQVQGAALEIPAKSACLMDIHTGQVLYEQDSHTPLPPASVTKVMTMLLVMEALDSGQIKLTDMVTASANAAAKGGSQIFLKEGEQLSVEEMLKSVAVSSANDCACALAELLAGSESAFVEKMNQRAKALGMNDTHFVNCTGLDDDENAKNHLTSAYDIAIMSRQLLKYHPDITRYTTIWMDTVRNGAFGLSNTNKLVRFYPGATGLKTGFTSGAGYCLSAAASRDGLSLVGVVMGAKTSQDRFNACRTMLDHGFAGYALVMPQVDGEWTVPVKLGLENSITAQPGEDTALLIDKSQKGSVTTEITLLDSVTAPISRGQRLGTMRVRAGEQVLREIPLVSQREIPRLTLGQLFLQVLQKTCMG